MHLSRCDYSYTHIQCNLWITTAKSNQYSFRNEKGLGDRMTPYYPQSCG